MSRLFDGVDDNLVVNSTPVTGVPFTLACWFYPTDLTVDGFLLGVCDKDVTNHFHAIRSMGSQASDPLWASSQAGVSGTAGAANGQVANAWNHGAGVFTTNTDRRPYLNGVAGSSGTGGVTPAGLDRTYVGRLMASTQAETFKGRIADAAIWNVALTAGEIAALARGVSPIRIRPAALVFYTPLWGTAATERDYTAGQRHLTVTGATVDAHAPVRPMGSDGPAVPLAVSAGSVTVVAPPMTATGSSPGLSASLTFEVPPVTATGVFLPPAVSVSGSTTVVAPPMLATGSVPIPGFTGSPDPNAIRLVQRETSRYLVHQEV